jgi:NAD(P)-dependent dehydrogenase (short-subunit alcohol dehydrogenase family)
MIGLRVGLATLATVGLLVAGCGDDDDDSGETTTAAAAVPGAEEAAALQADIADLSDDEQITRVGDEWADLFGKGDEAMCGYLHPDLGGASSCAGYLTGTLTQSSPLQASFEGATVESLEVDGETAFAEFSTGNRVKFEPDPDGAWKVIETPRATQSGSDEVVQPG